MKGEAGKKYRRGRGQCRCPYYYAPMACRLTTWQVLPYVVRRTFKGTMEGRRVDIGAWAWTCLNMWVMKTKNVSIHTEDTLQQGDEWLQPLMDVCAGPWAEYQTSGFAFPKFHMMTHIRAQIR
jgi:hypothetical protein